MGRALHFNQLVYVKPFMEHLRLNIINIDSDYIGDRRKINTDNSAYSTIYTELSFELSFYY